MGNVTYDENSNWSREDQRAMHHMCPLCKRLDLDKGLRNINPDTGAWEGPVTGNAVNDYATFGAFASLLKGSGLLLNADHKFGVAVYTDDGGVDLNVPDSVRGIQSRTLLTTSHTGCTVRALQGQLKVVTGKSVGTGVYTASQAYVELVGTLTVAANATFSCLNASMELGGVLTVASGGFACGIHVETTGAGTITNGGTCAGILVSNASGAADWPVGIDLTDSCTTGIDIGACTTGISFTGAVTTGISFTGNATDGIKISGGTVVDAIEIGACTYAVNVSGATTDAVRIAGDAVYGIDITNGCSPTAGFLMAGAGAYAIDVTGVQTTMVMRANSQTKPLYQGGTTITLSGASVNAYEINATSAANAAYTLTGLAVTTIPSTADQATSSLTGIYSEVRSTFNVAALRAVTGYINCSAAKAIASESSAVFGDVNVDNATTQTAGRLSAVHAKVRGDSALTGLLDVMHVDAEMSVDTGIYMNVDTSMTATVGIALAGAGTYTTGISMTATAIGTGIYMTGPNVTQGIVIGAEEFTTAGTGIVVNGVTLHSGCEFYFDDGGVKLAAGYTEAFRCGYLVSTEITTADVSVYTAHDYIYLANSVTTSGGVGATWASLLVKAGKTITTSSGLCDFSAFNASVDVPSTAVIGTGTWACGLAIGGNLGGTHTGNAAGIRLRVPSAGKWDVGLRIEPTSCVEAIQIGTAAFSAAGTGIPLDGVTQHSGIEIYFDDGGTKLAAGYTEAVMQGFLVSTAITTADVSLYTSHDYVYLAADVTTAGGIGASWASMLVKAGVTITTSSGVCDFSAFNASCDVPSTAVIGTGTFVAGISMGGNLGGTHTGKAVAFRVRSPSAGAWDGLFDIPSALSGGADGGGAAVYIDCYIAGVAARLTAKYVS